MPDAFGNQVRVGDTVICSPFSTKRTEYLVGEVIQLIAPKPLSARARWGRGRLLPERVEVRVIRNSGRYAYTKNPILHASNVVVIEGPDAVHTP